MPPASRYARPQSAAPSRGRPGSGKAGRPRSAPLDAIDDTEEVDGLPPGDDLPDFDEGDEDEDEDEIVEEEEEEEEEEGDYADEEEEEQGVAMQAANSDHVATALVQPPPSLDPFSEEEEAIIRRKQLMLDQPTHAVASYAARSTEGVLIEMRRGAIIRSSAGALRGAELAQQLSSTLKIVHALQERMKTNVPAWITLSRFQGVVGLIARDLRETRPGSNTAGANAGRCVALTKQVDAMRSLQVRLRPAQVAACAHLAWN